MVELRQAVGDDELTGLFVRLRRKCSAPARDMYIVLAYTSGVEAKGGRWNLRVTTAQDAVVRRVLEVTGESLNEYVVRHAVQAAETDLADRRVFVLDDAAWADLHALLDRPPTPKPELARPLANPSILER
ncbi:MAG: DUF1778 domain-containing protein [Mycobacterium sp.]